MVVAWERAEMSVIQAELMTYHTALICWGSPLSLPGLELALLLVKWYTRSSWPTCRSRTGSSAVSVLRIKTAESKTATLVNDRGWGLRSTAVYFQKATRLIITRSVFVLRLISLNWSFNSLILKAASTD